MLATRLLLAARRAFAEARTPPRIASDAAVAAFYRDVTALLRHGADLIGLVAVAGGLLLLMVGAVAGRRRGTGSRI